MPKLPRLTAKDLIKILEKNGFSLARQSGSHMIYRNAEGIRATVPFHAKKIIHPKIIKRIFEDIKINPDEVKEEPRIELIEVDEDTQALMDDVVTENVD